MAACGRIVHRIDKLVVRNHGDCQDLRLKFDGFCVRTRHKSLISNARFDNNYVRHQSLLIIPTFRVLYVFIILRHDRRQIVHFNVTTNPHAEWTAQQTVDAFPYEEAPRFLIRDRDGIYGDYFKNRVKDMGIEEVPIAAHAPWQNPYCERVIGSLRRECLDHMIVLNEAHLKRILASYLQYYHDSRPHLSLDRRSSAGIFPSDEVFGKGQGGDPLGAARDDGDGGFVGWRLLGL